MCEISEISHKIFVIQNYTMRLSNYKVGTVMKETEQLIPFKTISKYLEQYQHFSLAVQ